MVAEDEHALICDLAETYGIYDYHKLPARTVAILATGLREDSRIFMKKAKMPAQETQFCWQASQTESEYLMLR